VCKRLATHCSAPWLDWRADGWSSPLRRAGVTAREPDHSPSVLTCDWTSLGAAGADACVLSRNRGSKCSTEDQVSLRSKSDDTRMRQIRESTLAHRRTLRVYSRRSHPGKCQFQPEYRLGMESARFQLEVETAKLAHAEQSSKNSGPHKRRLRPAGVRRSKPHTSKQRSGPGHKAQTDRGT
jgi:hypothetical protein